MEVPDRFLVDTGKVFSALRQIKTSKSSDPDNFPNKLLKIFAFELDQLLLIFTMLQCYKENLRNN